MESLGWGGEGLAWAVPGRVPPHHIGKMLLLQQGVRVWVGWGGGRGEEGSAGACPPHPHAQEL